MAVGLTPYPSQYLALVIVDSVLLVRHYDTLGPELALTLVLIRASLSILRAD